MNGYPGDLFISATIHLSPRFRAQRILVDMQGTVRGTATCIARMHGFSIVQARLGAEWVINSTISGSGCMMVGVLVHGCRLHCCGVWRSSVLYYVGLFHCVTINFSQNTFLFHGLLKHMKGLERLSWAIGCREAALSTLAHGGLGGFTIHSNPPSLLEGIEHAILLKKIQHSAVTFLQATGAPITRSKASHDEAGYLRQH